MLCRWKLQTQCGSVFELRWLWSSSRLLVVFDRDRRKHHSEVKLKNAFNKHSTLYSWWICEWVFKLSVRVKLLLQLCKVWKCVKRVIDVHLGRSQEMPFVCNESLRIESTAPWTRSHYLIDLTLFNVWCKRNVKYLLYIVQYF